MFIGIKTGWAPGKKILGAQLAPGEKILSFVFVPALHYFFILYSTRYTQLIPYYSVFTATQYNFCFLLTNSLQVRGPGTKDDCRKDNSS